MSEQIEFYAEMHNLTVKELVDAFYSAREACSKFKATEKFGSLCSHEKRGDGMNCNYSVCPLLDRGE